MLVWLAITGYNAPSEQLVVDFLTHSWWSNKEMISHGFKTKRLVRDLNIATSLWRDINIKGCQLIAKGQTTNSSLFEFINNNSQQKTQFLVLLQIGRAHV